MCGLLTQPTAVLQNGRAASRSQTMPGAPGLLGAEWGMGMCRTNPSLPRPWRVPTAHLKRGAQHSEGGQDKVPALRQPAARGNQTTSMNSSGTQSPLWAHGESTVDWTTFVSMDVKYKPLYFFTLLFSLWLFAYILCLLH